MTESASLLRHARLIHAGFVLGPTIFAVVVWRLNEPMVLNPDERRLVLYIWMAIVVGATLAALKLWRLRVEPMTTPLEQSDVANGGAEAGESGSLLPSLIAVWAVVEGAAIAGLALYFLTGLGTLLVGSLAMIWLGALFARPRAEWFAASGAR